MPALFQWTQVCNNAMHNSTSTLLHFTNIKLLQLCLCRLYYSLAHQLTMCSFLTHAPHSRVYCTSQRVFIQTACMSCMHCELRLTPYHALHDTSYLNYTTSNLVNNNFLTATGDGAWRLYVTAKTPACS